VYRSIHTSIWNDPKIRSLDTTAKLLAVYLFSNDRTHVTGLYCFSLAMAADELDIGIPTVQKAFEKLCRVGFCKWDEQRRVIWVVNMWKRQPHSSIHLKRIQNHLLTLNGSPLVWEFIERYKDDNIPVTKLSPPRHQPVTDLSRQETETETEKELPPNPPQGGGRRRNRLPLLQTQEELSPVLEDIDLQPYRDEWGPKGLDVDACWVNFRDFVLMGSARDPFPNPAKWRDFKKAFRDKCQRSIDRGEYMIRGSPKSSRFMPEDFYAKGD